MPYPFDLLSRLSCFGSAALYCRFFSKCAMPPKPPISLALLVFVADRQVSDSLETYVEGEQAVEGILGRVTNGL